MTVDRLNVEIHPDRNLMGQAAAQRAASILRQTLANQGRARMIAASAPSQQELISFLAAAPDLDWSRITVFHMDEYVGLPEGHPATFRDWQQRHLLSQVRPAVFHGIRGETADLEAEMSRYTALLQEAPIDLVCMGIGENGHIAFNDPPVADFQDPFRIKKVELDEACRQQQVNDGCFPDFASVPTHALTLTCPALMSGRSLVCVVPGPRKASAIKATLQGHISTACPATVLRQHSDAVLYLDADSARGLKS